MIAKTLALTALTILTLALFIAGAVTSSLPMLGISMALAVLGICGLAAHTIVNIVTPQN